MPSSLLDVCRFNPTAGGATDWTYSSAVTGYQSPAAAGAANGAIYSYRAESNDLSQWEIGTGTYNSGTGVFSRTTVLFNSSGTTAKISFSTTPQVAIVALAEDLPSLVNNNSLAGAQNIFNTTEATGLGTTAAALIAGGLEIAKKLFVAGIAKFTNATASTSTTTGAVVVTGGVGVGGNVVAAALAPTVQPSVAWGLDFSGISVAIAAGGNSAIQVGAGMIFLTDSSISGSTGLYLVGGSAAALIGQSTAAANFVAPTTTPAAAKYSVSFDGTSQYRIYNGAASAVTFYVGTLRARPAV